VFVDAVTCLVPNEAEASPLRFEAEGGAEVADYTSTERAPSGGVLDRESGALGGGSLSAGLSWRHWRLELAASLVLGTINYQGHTQRGLPLTTQTRLQHLQLALRPTYQIVSTPFFIGASLEDRTIDRRIEATMLAQGLHETLNQWQLGPLWGARWESSFGLWVELWARVVWTFASTLDVDFEGLYDNGTLSLPSSDAESAAIDLSYAIVPRVSVSAEAKGETFRPAPSASVPLTRNGVPVGIYNYPGSVQDQWSVSIGVRTSF
jgi:hypothetical protein